ncbi:MAG TPA: hypothetical protein VLC91_03420 [Spongiibacteraceae bacterium]|nr:hypothetical protein [Spongiibacteraceae bacterium]
MSELTDQIRQDPVIRVLGIGGIGSRYIRQIMASDIQGVDFILVDLSLPPHATFLHNAELHFSSIFEKKFDPNDGASLAKDAGIEGHGQIAEILKGADMIFVIGDMFDVAAVSGIAKSFGILTLALVVQSALPKSESLKEIVVGVAGLADSVIVFSTQSEFNDAAAELNIFSAVGNKLVATIRGIVDLMVRPGLINVDFLDVRAVMDGGGLSTVGVGVASGDNRAHDAALAAIRGATINGGDLIGASGFLVNITAGLDLSLEEFAQVGDSIEEFASENATVVLGTVIDPEMHHAISVTLVATGLDVAGRLPVDVFSESNEPLLKPTLVYTDLDSSESPNYARIIRERVMGPSEQTSEYLDIPAFLRRPAGDDSDFNWRSTDLLDHTDSVCLVANENVRDEDIALLVYHLSNLYKSIGGDELNIENVTRLPTNPMDVKVVSAHQKRRNVGR